MSERCATALGLASILALLGCPAAVRAQTVNRRGSEFQVNTYTTQSQTYPKVALDSDGDFVVVWSSQNQDGPNGYGVFLQRFDSSGSPLASELQVNTYTTSGQTHPAIAAESNGDFVVVWPSFTQDGTGGIYGVFARRFDSAGTALATEFQVNTYTPEYQNRPSVASDADGDFVVAWQSRYQDGSSWGIFGQRFDSSGAAVAAEFQINSHTSNPQYRPSVALEPDGDFVVAWDAANGHDGTGFGVFAQRFSSAGVKQAFEFQVNTYTTGDQRSPSVAIRDDGAFVVAWQSQYQDGPVDGSYGVFARRFSSAGVGLASEFQVNTYTLNYQREPSAAADSDGDFVVAWLSEAQDGSDQGVFGRRFNSAGLAQGPEFQINSHTPQTQAVPAIDFDSDGDFVVVWHSAQDGSNFGAFSQRFSIPALATLDVDGNGSLGALTDGLLIVRHLFSFTGTTLTSAAVGANCSRCDSAAIAPYIAGLGGVLDIDDSGSLGALTDGLLIVRFLFGFTGTTLTSGAVGACGTRCDAATILPYLQTLD